ncbi:MAG: hypothetical protein IJT44_07580 [Clostridia bacterium]|nr:hypothetical protein [Clostridia bacterium]
MKKYIAVVLTAALVLCSLVFSPAAQDVYPQSTHAYANNTSQTWEYVYPGDADALYITFSADTYFHPQQYYCTITEDTPETYVRKFYENGFYETDGDTLTIYDADGQMQGCYAGDELSGAAVRVRGNRFSLLLQTDYAGAAYGFRVVDVSPVPPKSHARALFQIDGMTIERLLRDGDVIRLPRRYSFLQSDDHRILVGWQSADGEKVYYDPRNIPEGKDLTHDSDLTDIAAEAGKQYIFTPIWCKIGIDRTEVFSFLNSDSVFNADVDGYLYTRSHFLRFLTNWFGTFALSPFAPLAAVGCMYMTLFWPTQIFIGSCCGFPITVLLQHYGKLDLLSPQGVSCVAELEPDDLVQSTINYYNNQAVACHLVNHVAINPGGKEYTAQLQAMYRTLEQGTPVYLEIYGESHPLKTILTGNLSDGIGGVHGVLLTGAYTDAQGNHILIMYDNNSSMYPSGRCNVLYIDPDFTQLSGSIFYFGIETLNGFSWNEDVSQFDSFKTQGVSNPFAWHRQFWKNLPSLVRQIRELREAR